MSSTADLGLNDHDRDLLAGAREACARMLASSASARPFAITELVEDGDDYPSVRRFVTRLREQGAIESVSRGRFQIIDDDVVHHLAADEAALARALWPTRVFGQPPRTSQRLRTAPPPPSSSSDVGAAPPPASTAANDSNDSADAELLKALMGIYDVLDAFKDRLDRMERTLAAAPAPRVSGGGIGEKEFARLEHALETAVAVSARTKSESVRELEDRFGKRLVEMEAHLARSLVGHAEELAGARSDVRAALDAVIKLADVVETVESDVSVAAMEAIATRMMADVPTDDSIEEAVTRVLDDRMTQLHRWMVDEYARNVKAGAERLGADITTLFAEMLKSQIALKENYDSMDVALSRLADYFGTAVDKEVGKLRSMRSSAIAIRPVALSASLVGKKDGSQ